MNDTMHLHLMITISKPNDPALANWPMMECHLGNGPLHTIELMRQHGENCETPRLIELIEREYDEATEDNLPQLHGEITRLLSLVYFEGYRNGHAERRE